MVLLVPTWCLLLGLCVLVPTITSQGGPGEDMPPSMRMEELESQQDEEEPLLHLQGCGITFHTPSPCSSTHGPPAPASPHQLEHLQNLLLATKASLKEVEMAAMLEDNQTSYQAFITEALPTIHGDNLELQESLENVHRELQAHVAQAEHPQLLEMKEKLQKGVQVVAHMLQLTSHLAQSLEDISHHLQAELSQRLQSSTTHLSPTREP